MEVALRGLSSAGNDYDCQDGELQVCHNAINNGAGLRPIQEPTAIAELPAGWKGLAFVHHTSAGDTYIIRDGSGNAWYGKADDIQTGESAAGALTQMTEPQAGLFKDGEYQLSSVGNVLVVNFSGAGVANGTKGIHYYRWNDDQDCYKYLGQYPPDLKLEFSMVHYSGHVESDGSITYNDGCLMYYETGQSVMSFSADDSFTQGSMICYPDGNSDYDKLVDELLGKVNKIKGEMRRQGLFLGRVFVRTAYKLYDGNYIMQSAPVLLAPTMEDNPLVWPYSIDPLRLDSAGKGEWSIGVKYRIYFRPFVLCVKSLATAEDKAKLKEWKEVIDEVCVFVTPELQDYVEEPGYMVLKRKEKMGKDRWYEKISMQYTGKMTNSVTTTESEIFTKKTLENMKNGIEHSIPVSASFNVFNYINLSPSFNYNEKWFFKKVEYEWNPMTNKVDTMANEYGFYRLYNYSMSVSASTTVYGMYDFTKKKRDRKIQAIRHVLTPSIGFSYTPDFGDFKYGYYKSLQRDSLGTTQTYSPYAQNAYSVPSSGRAMSMNFSLSQNLEMKVLSKRDTSGVKKIKLIDELRISGSYNFLADSMRLSTIPISFRTTLFGNFGINLSATLDPYRLTPDGKRINKLFFPGRIVSTGWSFGYTFKSRDDRSQTAINDITSIPPEYMNPFYDPYGTMDPVLRRQYMAQTYYDFSLPWNFGFNYTVNYSITTGNYPPKGYKKNVTQTVGFNGSLNLTPKMGITFQGGYDIKANRLTTSSVSITRDLHCWQMSFSWIPFGTYRSWSFNIGVKAASLSDLKYDKSQSMYENMY